MKKGIRYESFVPARSSGKTFIRLYNAIKEKRDNAQLELDNTDKIDYNTKAELKSEINAYNDVLSLIESMGVNNDK